MPLCSLMDDEKLVEELLSTVGELEYLERGHEAEEKRYVLVAASQKQLRGEVLRRLAAKAWRRLWLLEPVKGLPKNDDPWRYCNDATYGFVVRAETRADAREYADTNAGDENNDERIAHPWLDAKYTTCTEMTSDGKPGVILTDDRSVR